ncbi:copper chaperone PCu(A)C [Sinosporangium siamense]|uniref:Copper chaperone PCu(A)C n=1 Tax=Sinosporangium siamense TaxID=1367973 RepID=A0A919RPS2_9ACTN|nr:copper chaperone PCu(A)C [Sinosporangium siamense]GII97493.1 hypothetical protein Ssi02_77240 [Sinosporangium siamense]
MLLLGLVGASAGCAPFPSQEAPLSPEGAKVSQGLLLLQNVSVLGPVPTQTLPAGASAPVYFMVINKSGAPDTLVAMSAPGVAASVELSKAPVAVPAHSSVWVGGGVTATLKGLTSPLQVGQFVTVRTRFEKAGEIVVPDVPVQPASYASTLPSRPPSPPPSRPPSPLPS